MNVLLVRVMVRSQVVWWLDAGPARFLLQQRGLTMVPEHFAALLPTLGVWMTAGLATGWLVGLLSRASGGRR